ncbi:MAG TPA: hypothetical protein VFO05_10685 [Candidatus Limnocylindrales bacterium]|nr:hypothetical protein [Candidatus Limnocylindrales bacterium]
MTTTAQRQSTWPTSLAIGVALGWFAVLSLAMWLGSNAPRPIAAWLVAYPMFALFPGVAGLAVSRAKSPGLVTALSTAVPMAALWLVLQSSTVQETPFGTRDDRLKYGIYAVVIGLGLLVAIRTGARLMRSGHTLLGFLAAGLIFVGVAALASYLLLFVTAY